MFEQLRFYINHSLNDLWVNKRLTFFALLSIAAGVAAIVSLQTLASMISGTLNQNLQASNRGDISISMGGLPNEFVDQGVAEGVIEQPGSGAFVGASGYMISARGLETIRQWIENSGYSGQVDFTYQVYLNGPQAAFMGGYGTAMTAVTSGENVSQLTPVMVETDLYPFYSAILTLDGQTLAAAFNAPNDVVITEKVADDLQVGVGDTVRLSEATADFVVRGIVSDDAGIVGSSDLLLGLFGYYYLDVSALEYFPDVPLAASNLYFRLDDPNKLEQVRAGLAERFPYLSLQTTEDARQANEKVSEQITQLVTIMGLISLLIGSIGIINTMQVVVRRRTVEVAVLKTMGLQAGQVTQLFLTEAFILGIVGSLAGIVLGWVAVFAIKGTAEAAFAVELPFRIAPVPAINGFIVGILVTTVFGFLPTLTAGQVRPGIVLRPSDDIVPRAGRLRSVLALVVMILVLSGIASGIMGNPALAFGVVTGAFITAGLLLVLLLFLIWLIGRFFPSLGIVDLKIALRQMLAGRMRGAITLLALVIGVFTLSFITLFADSITMLLKSMMETQGNLLVQVQGINQLASTETILQAAEGVNSYDVTLMYATEFVRWESTANGATYNEDALTALLSEKDFTLPGIFVGTEEQRIELGKSVLTLSLRVFEAAPLDDLPEVAITAGRQLTESDAGKPVFVMIAQDIWNQVGVAPGDKFTFRLRGAGLPQSAGEEVTFELVGIAKPPAANIGFGNPTVYAPRDAFPQNTPVATIQILADVNDEQVSQVRRELSAVPGTFALETSVFTQFIEKLLGTFIAFPSLVAALGLIVGGVVIANSVALTTMERRHEIAVMKSIGLQRGRVLAMILLENSILGLIGGLIGVGIGLVGLLIVTSVSGLTGAVPVGTGLLLMLLCIVVALVAAVSSAWSASGEKPLNVLRYE